MHKEGEEGESGQGVGRLDECSKGGRKRGEGSCEMVNGDECAWGVWRDDTCECGLASAAFPKVGDPQVASSRLDDTGSADTLPSHLRERACERPVM